MISLRELRRTRKPLCLAALCVAGFAAHPALGATASASSEGVIVAPNTLIKTDDLMFGSIMPSATAGTVTIAAATGARTSTGGATPVGAGYQRAEFVGMAPIGIFTNVTLPSGTTTLNRVGGGASMNATLAVEGGTGIRWFPGTGVQTFRVGGTLNVGANQTAGQYLGTFTLQVDYL
jgi:hypothetical protein